LHMPGADADATTGDRTYLVLAKPNVIMNDTRIRGLGVAGTDPAGRKSPDNHAEERLMPMSKELAQERGLHLEGMVSPRLWRRMTSL
jgi:hypothetical protein